MAVTLSGTSVTFNDGSVQTTEATLLGGVQYTGYIAVNVYGYQGYQTATADVFFFAGNAGHQLIGNPASSTSVICGMQAYRTATVQIGDDGYQDAGTIQRRIVYRSVGTA